MISNISNGKVMIIHLIFGLAKKKFLYKTNYFPEPRTRNTKEVELDLANCATKSDLKNATGADTSKLAEKVD